MSNMQQYVCLLCGAVGASPKYSKIPWCHCCSDKVKMVPSHNGRPIGFKKSPRTGRIVCRCGRGYGSDFDGLCIYCRGGVTGWEARQRAQQR